MMEYDRLTDLLTKIIKFCPVCGEQLVIITAKNTIKNPPDPPKVITYEYKTCPQDHATLDVHSSWDPREGNPDAVFRLEHILFE